MGERLVRHAGQNTSGFATPVSGHREDRPVDVIGASSLIWIAWPIIEPSRQSVGCFSFNQFISAGEQRGGKYQAKFPGGRKVDDELEARRLLNWKFGRICSPKNTVHLRCRQAIGLSEGCPVADHAAGLRHLAPLAHGRQVSSLGLPRDFACGTVEHRRGEHAQSLELRGSLPVALRPRWHRAD